MPLKRKEWNEDDCLALCSVFSKGRGNANKSLDLDALPLTISWKALKDQGITPSEYLSILQHPVYIHFNEKDEKPEMERARKVALIMRLGGGCAAAKDPQKFNLLESEQNNCCHITLHNLHFHHLQPGQCHLSDFRMLHKVNGRQMQMTTIINELPVLVILCARHHQMVHCILS